MCLSPFVRVLLVVVLAVAFGSFVESALATAPYQYEAALSEKLAIDVPGGFLEPWGIAFDAPGNLFLSDLHGVARRRIIDRFDAANAFQPPLRSPALFRAFTRSAAVGDEVRYVYVPTSDFSHVFSADPPSGRSLALEQRQHPAKPSNAGDSCCFLYHAVRNSNSAPSASSM